MKAKIHLEETLSIKADSKGEVVSTDSSGSLSIINPSDKTTLWGINLSADYKEDVQTEVKETIAHIESNKDHKVEYGTNVAPKIVITEAFDTNYSGNEINSENRDIVFNIDQTLAFHIDIINNYDVPIKNITMEKRFPEDTKDIRAIDPFIGEVSIDEEQKTAVWTIPEIKAGENKGIILASTIHPSKIQPYNSGTIMIKCEMDSKLSTISPIIDGDADNVDLGLEAIETTVPNQWEVNFGLRNASEFEIFLKQVNINVNGEEKYAKDLNLELDSNPDEPIWKNQILVKSPSYPEITKNFDYYVLYEISEHTTINYNKDNNQINVVRVGVAKEFDPPTVVTHGITDIVSTIDITNTGTAIVGKIKIEDTIPSYVEIDEIIAEAAQKQIEIECEEKPKAEPKPVVIEEQRERATFEHLEEGTLEKPEEPEEEIEIPAHLQEDISQPRKYHYKIKDLKMEPGKSIKIKVMGKANKPKFDGPQPAPATIKAFAEQPTLAYLTQALMDDKEPILNVEFKKRSYKLTSIFKKIDDDDYEIEIPVSNTGDVALDNVIITQPIFNAEYRSHTPPTVDVTVQGDSVKCHISKINPAETTTIVLQVRAGAPLRQQQASIRIED